MRRLIACAVVIAACVAAAPALAAPSSKPRVTVNPQTVRLGATTLIRGTNFPVIEFCRRTVRLTLRSDQNAVPIGTARVRSNGTFSRPFRARASEVGPGRWRVVARLSCESGEDGSPNPVFGAAKLRIRR